VLYLGTGSEPDVVAMMDAGRLGLMLGPGANSRSSYPDHVSWGADNGCFANNYNPDRWWSWLTRWARFAPSALFACAPDVVCDAEATRDLSTPWLAPIRSLGYPVAYVGQNGQSDVPVPWDDIDAFFIGGDDPWKLGGEAADLASEAKARGKWVHMGRVNSGRRWRYAERIGCDSVDGTFLRWPTTNLPRLRTWINASDQLDLFAEAAA
jgi:hypothetical protein